MKKLGLLLVLVLSVTLANAMTRTSVNVNSLPKAIKENISTQHQGWTAIEAFKIDTKGVVSYEVVVRKATDRATLYYDKDGKFLKSEEHKAAMTNSPKNSMNSTTTPSSTPKPAPKN